MRNIRLGPGRAHTVWLRPHQAVMLRGRHGSIFVTERDDGTFAINPSRYTGEETLDVRDVTGERKIVTGAGVHVGYTGR